MKTLKEFNFKNKTVLVRCDFNVPLDNQGVSFPSEIEILDDFKIKEAIPTIEYLMEKEAKIILMSHLGRPDGRVVEELRLTPIQTRLMEYLDVSITKSTDCCSLEIEKWIKEMNPGEILLLENIQFHPGEKQNDPQFAKTLAGYADIFIMEAFGQAHRNYASISGIPNYLPSGAGFLFEKEIKALASLMKNPRKPLIAVIGGAKVETKMKMIDNISEVADFVLLGGLINQEIINQSRHLKYPQKIIAPIDEMFGGKDIGPKTVHLFKEKISLAKTVFWNGPLGLIEQTDSSFGSSEIAKAIVGSGAFSVVGGGETAEFINRLGLIEKFNHISTGGGAMLAFLSGEKLPGIEALS
ncbi:MAG: phosphoglycerate kinase [Candidatus Nealsonbacteria bacterium]|nr:phosphoglycerate kinase [Candidatus Nealsonbacteria bacterium]